MIKKLFILIFLFFVLFSVSICAKTEIKGYEKDKSININFTEKNNIIFVKESYNDLIDNATIEKDFISSFPVGLVEVMYKSNKDKDFKKAIPYCKKNIITEYIITKDDKNCKISKHDPLAIYCKNKIKIKEVQTEVEDFGNCYNSPKIKDNKIKVNVEHFSDYNISLTGFNSLQSCLKYINNSDSTCQLLKSNYTEYFNSSDSYNLTGNQYNIEIIDLSNININFNNSNFIQHEKFILLQNSLNLNLSNINVNYLQSLHSNVITGGTGLKGNYTFDGFRVHGCNDFTDFGTGNLQSTIIFKNSIINCTGKVSPYASNLEVVNNTFYGSSKIFLQWNNRLNNITNNTFFNNSFIEINGQELNTTTIKNNHFYNKVIIPNNLFINDYNLYNFHIEGNIFEKSNNGTLLKNFKYNTTIINNTFLDCGNYSILGNYVSSYYPFNISNMLFNHMIFIKNDASAIFEITEDDQILPSWIDGTLSFPRTWAYEDTNNIMGKGAGALLSLIVQNGYPYSCSFIVGAYGGVCHFTNETNSILNSGLGNPYIWNDGVLNYTQNKNVTYPPFIFNKSIVNNQYYCIDGQNMTNSLIKNNIFSSGGSPLIIKNSSNLVYLNHFLSSDVVDDGATFCSGGLGNFYRENLTPSTSDCGQSSLILESNKVTWTEQNSLYPLNYYFLLSYDNSSWEILKNSSDLFHIFEDNLENVYFKLIPYYNNINATNQYLNNMTLYSVFCDISSTPILKSRNDIKCRTMGNDFRCLLYIKEDGKTIQSNPEKSQYLNQDGTLIYENTFVPNGNSINAYFTDQNLQAHKEYNLSLSCYNKTDLIVYSKMITPIYNEFDVIASKTIWAKTNANFIGLGVAVMLIIIVIIAISINIFK